MKVPSDTATSDEIPDRELLGHLLWEVGARVSLLSEAALARTPLTSRAAGMLEAIASDPGTSFAEISRRLPVTPRRWPRSRRGSRRRAS